jgi:hypothetical protein
MSLFSQIPGQQASVGGRICRCLLLFHEFDFEVVVNPRRLNACPYHLSKITNGEEPIISQILGWENPDPTTKQVM